MKKIYALLIGCFCFLSYAHAISYSWVGPLNGNWNDPMNWATTGTTGGAGVPGAGDDAIFTPFLQGKFVYSVNLDVSPTVKNLACLTSTRVTFYTWVNTVLTVTNIFQMGVFLKDSTVEDVKFELVLDHAAAYINGTSGSVNWIFTGRVPVSNGNGASLTIGNGSAVTIPSNATLTFAHNSGILTSAVSTLRFKAGSNYLLDNNLNGGIPAATWDPPINADAPPSEIYTPAPIIRINGDARTIRHSANTKYGSIYLDLYNLSADANLALPDGTVIVESLGVLNTNNHTLTLLEAAGTPSVTVQVLGSSYGSIGGSFTMAGSTSKVALAHTPDATSGTAYRLDILDFNQSAGNFSLQDANNYTGSSILAVRRGFRETGGTFVTNSTSSTAPVRFAVELTGPTFFGSPAGTTVSGNGISISSGSIDNATHMVTLRAAQSIAVGQTFPVGTGMSTPLQVGRLELNGGTIVSSAANLLTINNPSPDAVQITTTTSYVSGPVRRATNSTNPYTLPTGKGRGPAFNLDTCVVIPASATPSMYQAEYFPARYTDTTVSAPFKGVDTSRYWDISKVSGADAQVRLILPSAVPSASSTDNLVVAHYTGGKWVSEQGTVLSPGNAGTGSVTSKVLSAFSPFTFGYGAFINAPLAVHLISFDGHQENSGNRLSWKTASVASRFEVLRATDGINFSSIGTIAALSMQQQYTFFDNKPQPRKNFYRLRSVEKDGAVSLSDVIMINSAGSITELLTLTPTVVTGNASLRINALKDGQMELIVMDMAGRSWKKLELSVRAGSSSNTLNLSDLPAGTYQISGYMDGNKTAAVRFIKH